MNSFFTAAFLISPDFFLALFVNELACLNNFCDLRKGKFHEFHTDKPSFEKSPMSDFRIRWQGLKSLSRLNKSVASLQFSDGFGWGR